MSETISGTFSLSFSTPGVVVSNDFRITSVQGTANTGGGVLVSGTFSGSVPGNATAVWSPGNIVGAVSGFIVSGSTWTATVLVPPTEGIYTLIMTGAAPNGASSNFSSSVLVTTPTQTGALPAPLVSTQFFGTSGGTSAAIDTTGSALLYMSVGGIKARINQPTDSKGNTWLLAVASGTVPGNENQIFYAWNPTVGPGHTFSVTTTSDAYVSVQVGGFSNIITGSDPLSGTPTHNTGGASVQPGAQTPTVANSLILSGFTGRNSTSNASVDSGFTIINQTIEVTYTDFQGGIAYLVQTTPASVNPTWSNLVQDSAADMAIFLSGVGVPLIAITSIPTTISTSKSGILVGGTYSGARPTAMTAAWTGGGDASLTGFSSSGGSSGGTWSATVTAPGTQGTYALTATGTAGNTATSAPSSSTSVQNEAFAITTMPGTGNQSAGISVAGTFAGNIPTGINPAAWDNSGGNGTVTAFTVTGPGTWTATVSAPSAIGTYHLTATPTGPNTTVSAASSAIVISAIASTITITSIPSFADTSSTIAIGGTYAGSSALGGLTGVWSAGTGGGAISSFFASGGASGTWTANVTVSSTVVTATLTVHGTSGNTATSAPSSSVSIVTPGSAVLVQSFGVQNWNASGTSPGFIRIGTAWKKGDVPSTASVQVKRGATVIDAQFDDRSTWSDGSLKFAVCHFRDTTFTSSESRTYDAYRVPTSSFVNTGTKTLADITGAHDFKVAFTNTVETLYGGHIGYISGTALVIPDEDNVFSLGDPVYGAPLLTSVTPGTVITAVIDSKNYTINNSQTFGSDTNRKLLDRVAPTGVASGSLTARFGTTSTPGHSAVPTRVEKYHQGAVCEGWAVWGMATDNTSGVEDGYLKTNWYADIWKNSDGSIYAVEIGAVVAQDWFVAAAGTQAQRRGYNASLVDGSTSLVTYSNVVHCYRTQWLTCLNDGSNNRGRRMWVGGAMPTLVYKPDKTYWIKSNLVPPYDTTQSWVNAYANNPAVNNAVYVPGSNQDHRGSIDGQGGFPGRGIHTTFDAFAFLIQDGPSYATARINALAGFGVWYHGRSKALRTRPGDGSADIANTPLSFNMARSTGGVPAYDFTADGMPAVTGGNNENCWGVVYNSPPGGPGLYWYYNVTFGASHAANFSGGMYLLEGERHFLECTIDLATNCIHQRTDCDNVTLDGYTWPQTRAYASLPATTYNALAVGEERAYGNAMNLIGFASAFSPDTHVAKNFLKRYRQQMGLYLADLYAAYPADVKASGEMLFEQSIGVPNWQGAITTQTMIHAGLTNEDSNLLNWGFFKAQVTVNQVGKGVALTAAPIVLTTHQWNYAGIGQPNGYLAAPGGFTTDIIVMDLAFGDWDPAVDPTLMLFDHQPFGWQDFAGSAASFPSSGYWPENGDVFYQHHPYGSYYGTTEALLPEMLAHTPYYVVNAQRPAIGHPGRTSCQISATPGGAPITFTGTAARCHFDGWMQQLATLEPGGTGTDSQGVANAYNFPMIHYAGLILANIAGYAPATPTLITKLGHYLSSYNAAAQNDPPYTMKLPP